MIAQLKTEEILALNPFLHSDQFPKCEWIKVYQTETIFSSKDPTFQKVSITSSKLCGSNYNLPLKIDFYNYKSSGTHTIKGTVYFTVNSLKQGLSSNFNINPKNQCIYIFIYFF